MNPRARRATRRATPSPSRPPSRLVAGGLLVAVGLAACEGLPQSAGPEIVIEPLQAPALLAFEETADPSLAIDPATGDLLLAWGAAGEEGSEGWDLHLVRSSDGGDTFGTPARVNDRPGDLHPHAEGAPRLVAGPGVVSLFWNNRLEVEGRRFAASDLRYARSLDGGKTWSPARNLQDPLAFEGLPPRANTFHGAALAGDSTLVVAWLDGRERDARRLERGFAEGLDPVTVAATPEAFADEDDPHDGDASVFAAVSHDLGESWEPENRRISGNTCPCCRVELLGTPEGAVLGAWRAHLDGSVRDPVIHTLLGEGAGSSAPRQIHEDGWVFPGCPHSGPALDFGPDGVLHAAWYTGAEGRMGVYHAARAPGAEAFSPPVPVVAGSSVGVANPGIAALDDGRALVASNVAEDGRRVVVIALVSAEGGVLVSTELSGSEGGTHPQLVRLPDGRVVAAWTTSAGGVQRVELARVSVGGMP